MVIGLLVNQAEILYFDSLHDYFDCYDFIDFNDFLNLNYRIKENSLLARIAALKLKSKKVAIVFGSTVHLWGASREEFLANEKWVKHELKHIEQYQHYGSARFIFLYMKEWMKNGYRNNKFEVEARKAEGE